MDVHKDSVMVAVLPESSREPTVVKRLPNEARKLRRFFDRTARPGVIQACYEASGAGYVAAAGAHGVGVCVRGGGPVADPEASGGAAEETTGGTRPAVRRPRAHRAMPGPPPPPASPVPARAGRTRPTERGRPPLAGPARPAWRREGGTRGQIQGVSPPASRRPSRPPDRRGTVPRPRPAA